MRGHVHVCDGRHYSVRYTRIDGSADREGHPGAGRFAFVLRYMSFVHEIISALTLTFIAYPDAISQMPVPTLWALLFFVMMFMIGISTMLGEDLQ